MSRAHLFVPPLLVALSACSATPDIAAPRQHTSYSATLPDSVIAMLPTTQRKQLELAAWGLLYTSESDYPFVYVRRNGIMRSPTAAPTIAEFRALFGISANTPVEIITLDTFFARHIERVDPADDVAQALVPRYMNLRETLRTSLSQVVVYRVGAIAIDCYVVGFNANGDLEGMTTISIET
ncbi:MAG: nuclease A inhibitor family protein [bacterium]